MSLYNVQKAPSDHGGGSHSDNLIGINEYEFSLPPEKEFLPWHKPRKQFVRNDQWVHYVGKLVDEIRSESTLTYFGLPGVDLLDLRYFGSTVCDPRSLKLRFLGFNSEANPGSTQQAELNISIDEISKASFFDPQSEIVPDDFRQLVDDDSIAWQKTLEFGPYDVVNLDLCDGFAKQSSGPVPETYYNALSKLMGIQARRKAPWLLLLTTRVGPRHVHRNTFHQLSKLYGSNLSGCPDFKVASNKAFSIDDQSALDKAKTSDKGQQAIFLVGICKWLLSLSLGQNPQSAMRVKSTLGYRVKPEATIEDMVSIAIQFEPVNGAITDPTGLASATPPKLDECELATSALKKVHGLIDVDDLLSSQPVLMEEMVVAMSELLTSARYDVTEYRKWAGV